MKTLMQTQGAGGICASGTEEPQREPELRREINRLKEMERHLAELATDLTNRLQPIAHEPHPKDKEGPTTAEVPPSCELAVSLRNVRDAFGGTAAAIESLLERLEV